MFKLKKVLIHLQVLKLQQNVVFMQVSKRFLLFFANVCCINLIRSNI